MFNENLLEEFKKVIDDNYCKMNEKQENNDKDALISENARLKMKLKEKSYETAQLREKVKKLENGQTGIFKRIFGSNKKT